MVPRGSDAAVEAVPGRHPAPGDPRGASAQRGEAPRLSTGAPSPARSLLRRGATRPRHTEAREPGEARVVERVAAGLDDAGDFSSPRKRADVEVTCSPRRSRRPLLDLEEAPRVPSVTRVLPFGRRCAPPRWAEKNDTIGEARYCQTILPCAGSTSTMREASSCPSWCHALSNTRSCRSRARSRRAGGRARRAPTSSAARPSPGRRWRSCR